jgi:uncharacterized membrane protein YgdD (TMEM256/DUF423 family)
LPSGPRSGSRASVGAFGSHALRSRLTPERVATFETGVRYQLWHALALFAVVFVASLRFASPRTSTAYVLIEGSIHWPVWTAGWLFIVGIVLFLRQPVHARAHGRRTWGAVTPVGGVLLVLGWLALALEAWVA